MVWFNQLNTVTGPTLFFFSTQARTKMDRHKVKVRYGGEATTTADARRVPGRYALDGSDG